MVYHLAAFLRSRNCATVKKHDQYNVRGSAMGANVKRGFNRVFIVLASVWAAYCLVIYPKQQIKKADAEYAEFIGVCNANPYAPQDEKADCLKQAELTFKVGVEPWTFRNFYRGLWWLLILAVVIFPLVVYGCCRGAAAVGLWVWREFTRA